MGKKNKPKGNASEAAQASTSDKKVKNALLPEPKIAKSSPVQKQFKGKNLQKVHEAINLNDKKNEGQKDNVNSAENKEKLKKKLLYSNEKNKEVQKDSANSEAKKNNDKSQDEKNRFNKKGKEQMEQKNKERLSGLIFMCNSKTKPDCFRYMVMGFPDGRKELVARIKPGMKLFLYDYELRLLYGIYEAASAGGMKLEPAAFNGSFAAQVRFVVERDCSPLPINVFKSAIKENFEERKHTFKPELSIDQVKKLLNLFCSPAGQRISSAIKSNPHPTVQVLHVAPIIPTRAVLPTPHGGFANGPHTVPDIGRHYAKVAPTKGETTPAKNEDVSRVLTVKDYKTYGLQPKVQTQAPSSAPAGVPHSLVPHIAAPQFPVSHSTNPPMDPYLGRPDPYRSQHYPVTAPLDPYAVAPKAPYSDDRYLDIHRRGELGYAALGERSRLDTERLQSTYDAATSALSNYNRSQQRPGGNPDLSSVPVSSRYSFAGPPLSFC